MFISILTVILIFLTTLLFMFKISIYLLLLSIYNKRVNDNKELFINNNYYSSLEKKRQALFSQLLQKYGELNEKQKSPSQPLLPSQPSQPSQPLPPSQPSQPLPLSKQQKSQKISYCDDCKKNCINRVKYTTNKEINYGDERKYARKILKN